MLDQTRDARNQLLASGLERKDFQVRCKLIYKNGQFWGYGDVQVRLRCSLEKERELAPEIAKHFQVVMYTHDDKPIGGILVLDEKPVGLIKQKV